MALKNYYLILGVSGNATHDQIQSAYRRQAMELYPDRSGQDSGPFMAVQEAYSVLGDPERRHAYDQKIVASRAIRRSGRFAGEPLRARRSATEPFRAGRPESDWGEASLLRSFATISPSYDELFDRLWSNFDLLTRPKAERVESMAVEIPLSPDQARAGGRIQVRIPARMRCPACGGRGGIGFYECWRCAGGGVITGERPVWLEYPAGIMDHYAVQVSLDQFGIQNFYLTVNFRVTDSA